KLLSGEARRRDAVHLHRTVELIRDRERYAGGTIVRIVERKIGRRERVAAALIHGRHQIAGDEGRIVHWTDGKSERARRRRRTVLISVLDSNAEGRSRRFGTIVREAHHAGLKLLPGEARRRDAVH